MLQVLTNTTDVWAFVKKAIKNGDEAGLLSQIERQPELARMSDLDSETILYKVCAHQFSKRIVYTLLKQGANPGQPNSRNIVPIWQACNEQYPDEVILTMLAYGPKMDLKQKNNVRIVDLKSRTCF